ncbi:MAG: S8 family serine peptidase [Acidobacteriota bacterium]
MRRSGIFILLLGLIFFCLCAFPGAQSKNVKAAPSGRTVPTEVVVKLNNPDDLVAVALDYDLDPTPIAQFGARPIYLLKIVGGDSPNDRADALMADLQGRVAYAEPNFVAEPPEDSGRVLWSAGGGATEYYTQWVPLKIRLPEAHMVTRGAGNTIAVLDTGVDFNHPQLAGHLLPGYDFIDDDNDPTEVGVYGEDRGFGHGTHVTGLVALVAPDARIMPIRILNERGEGSLWTLAQGLLYAVDPDDNLSTNDGANIINLSLSTIERSKLIKDILRAVTCQDITSPDAFPCIKPGVVVVASAGNNGYDTLEYPAAEPVSGLISVGASTEFDTLASFSNFGSWVEIAAPGELVLSTVPGGGFGTWSGTSMAAPLVAGEAALVRSVLSKSAPSKIIQRITSSSADISGAVRERIDTAYAVGLSRLH